MNWKINKDLETIIGLQLEYEDILLKRIETEQFISENILERWREGRNKFKAKEYSQGRLTEKYIKALKDIKFLNHYIEQKSKKNSSIDERTESNEDKSGTNITQKKKEIRKHGIKKK